MPGELQTRVGAKVGPRIAMLVSQAIVYTHHKLHHMKHRLAMAVFHSISDEISEEVDTTLGPILAMLHEQLPEDHPMYPAVNFMHTQTGQLKAILGAGAQMSGVLGSLAAIMNNSIADVVYNIVGATPGQLPDTSTVAQIYATQLVGHDEALRALASQGIQFGWAERMLALSYNRPGLTEALELFRRGTIDHDGLVQYLWWNGVTNADAQKLATLATNPVSEADAALAVLRGNISEAEGQKIAAENGLDNAAFQILIGNTGEPPGLMQLLEAFRRGFIDQATLEKGILQSRYRNEWIPMLEKLRYVPMSVSDAARATVQNQMDIATARKYADENGLQPGDFDIIVATEGDPLSRTEMQSLYNRGLVSQDQVNQAERESRLKNKYVDLAFKLHQRQLSETTVARAVRLGEMTHADGVAKIMQLGYSTDDATSIIAATSGERLQTFKDRVVASVVTLYQDSVMSIADAQKLIQSMGYTAEETAFIIQSTEFHKESHVINTVITAIKTKYLQRHITKEVASGLIDKIGIPAVNRDYLLKLWEIEQGAYTRVLTPAQIVKAVNLDLIKADEGTTRLIGLGYAAADAKLLIEGA